VDKVDVYHFLQTISKGGVVMPRTNALINKETLAYICSHIGVTNTFIAQRTYIAEETIAKWLTVDDAAVPTINQAKTLAKALKVPFAGLYMSKEHINFKHLSNLRNLRTMPEGIAIDNSALNLALVDLIRAHDFLYASEEELGLVNAPLTLPAIPDDASPVEYARAIRDFYGLDLATQFRVTSARQFYLYIRQKVENKGIFIHCFTGVEVEAVRGISIFDDMNPIIGINDDDHYPAKTFSIIHELVHILKRQSTLCNDMYSSFTAQSEEVFCNAVAGESLVPTDALTAYFNAHTMTIITLDGIETIAQRFSVSREVITRRLYDTGRISKNIYDTFANEIRQSFEQEREATRIARQEGRGQTIPRNMSREAVDKNSTAICRVLLIGYGEGLFNKQDLSGLLGIKEKHIPKFISEVARL
jgi:Zn-dependent peptidase ImmA (M78 family)